MEKDREKTLGQYRTGLLVFVLCLGWFISGAQRASAASLFFSPGSGTHEVGQTFAVTVMVSSADKAMNAVSGSVVFPKEQVDVVSVSKSGSIIGLWVQDPTFSDSKVNFAGIVLNPGFIGPSGKVVTINFRAKAAGTATMNFTEASVLANDGSGTNILTGTGTATATITAGSQAPPAAPAVNKPPAATALPPLPVISSTSHPDQHAWYANSIADLRWALPPNTTGLSFAVDQKPDTLPDKQSAGVFDSYSTKKLADGVWYFHLRFKNSLGWGLGADFRFQIDTTPPVDFSIRLIDGAETSNPQPTTIFNTTDPGSGIDHYDVKVGEGDAVSVAGGVDLTSNPYVLPAQEPGNHRILVVAYDKAGNHASASADFTIDALNKPTITEYAQRLQVGDELVVKGTTGYPNTPVTIWVVQGAGNPQSASVRSDANGNFTYVSDYRVQEGVYKVWAQTVDDRGAKSSLSDQVTIIVETVPALQIASTGIPLWIAGLALFMILAIIIYFIGINRRKLKNIRQKNNKEGDEIEDVLHEAFDVLREQLDDKIHSLEHTRHGSRLSALEEKIVKEFKRDIEIAERKVTKKIQKIKKRKTGL